MTTMKKERDSGHKLKDLLQEIQEKRTSVKRSWEHVNEAIVRDTERVKRQMLSEVAKNFTPRLEEIDAEEQRMRQADRFASESKDTASKESLSVVYQTAPMKEDQPFATGLGQLATCSTASLETDFACAEKYANDEHWEQAVPIYKRLAQSGHIPATYRLMWCYELGLGVNKNMAAALFWNKMFPTPRANIPLSVME
jgi:hypothetical protein